MDNQRDSEVVDAPLSMQNGFDRNLMDELDPNDEDVPGLDGSKSSHNLSHDLNRLVSDIAECVDGAETLGSNMDGVVFEISTSVRLRNHASLEDFSCAVFMVLLKRIGDELSYQEKKEAVQRLTDKYCALFEKLAMKEDNQQLVITGLMRACGLRNMGLVYFFLDALDTLWENSIVSLEAIQHWNAARDKAATAAMGSGSKFEEYLAMSIESWLDAEEGSSGSEEDSS